MSERTAWDGPFRYWSARREESFDPVDSPSIDREDIDWMLLGICAEGMPEAFWSLLPPADALALLKAAPKVAGPREVGHRATYTRRPLYQVDRSSFDGGACDCEDRARRGRPTRARAHRHRARSHRERAQARSSGGRVTNVSD